MAQMNQMQKKFAKTHQTELAIMDTNEQASTSLMSGEEKDKKSRYVAIGAEKSMPQVRILKDFLQFCLVTICRNLSIKGLFNLYLIWA